jgi:small conductance mechanosensitive channel
VQNFTANPYRRVEVTAQLPREINLDAILERLRERLTHVPNVLRTPEPSVEILSITATGPVLTLRPFCHHDHYWQVYFDINRAINQVCWS